VLNEPKNLKIECQIYQSAPIYTWIFRYDGRT